MKLPISMEITWLDFQLSTNNQNGRHLVTTFSFLDLIFFFIIPLKPGIYRLSGSASLLALSVFACNRKRGFGGHLYFLIIKFLVNAITWKNNYWISPIFYVMLPMGMEMTWLDFQLSTENQNGRHLAINFFFFLLFFSDFPQNLVYIGFRGLRVYWHCPF